jgi:hypothetical protein
METSEVPEISEQMPAYWAAAASRADTRGNDPSTIDSRLAFFERSIAFASVSTLID